MPDVTVDEDAPQTQINLTNYFSEINNDMTFSVSTNNGALTTLEISNNLLNIDYALNGNGTSDVTVNASDSNSGLVSDTFTITVNQIDDAGSASVTGTFQQGEVLTAAPSDTSDGGVATINTYQWTRGGNDISGATSQTYTLTNEDVAKVINVAIAYTDGDGNSNNVTSDSTAQVTNVAPSVTAMPDITVLEDAARTQIDLTNYFSEINNDMTFSVTTNNNSLTTAEISNNFLNVDYALNENGSSIVTVTATDSNSGTVSDAFTITVTQVDDAATGNVDISGTVQEGSEVEADTSGLSDIDGDLTFAYQWQSSDVSNANFTDITDASNANFTIPSDQTMVDKYLRLQVVATDVSGGITTLNSTSQQVANVNDAPTFTSSGSTVATEDSFYSYTVVTSDVDGVDTITLTAPTKPTWLNFDAVSGVLSGTPANGDVGTHDVVINVNDGTVDVSQSFVISVGNVNDAPTITAATATLLVNEDVVNSTIDLTQHFVDIDLNDNLTFTSQVISQSVANLVTSSISGNNMIATYGANKHGTATIQVTATDKSFSAVSKNFSVNVTSVNDAPTITAAAATLSVNEDVVSSTVDLTQHFVDIDLNDTLTFTSQVTNESVSGLVTTSISGDDMIATYGANKHGTATIQVTATDLSNGSVNKDFSVIVTSVNDAPTAIGVASTTSVNEDAVATTIDLTQHFQDIDLSDTLTFTPVVSSQSVVGLVTPTISGDNMILTYGANLHGTATIAVTATDLSGISANKDFGVIVTSVNDVPTANGLDSSVLVSEDAVATTIDLAQHFVEIDLSDTLTFSSNVSNESVAGLVTTSISGDDMILTYGANKNGSATIVVTATDLSNSSATKNFTLTVSSVNDAPTFTSSGITSATQDSEYTYTVVTSEVDGELITLTGATIPSWLNFDASSGDLSGTPLNGNVGTHAVVINAFDGSFNVAQIFNIEVANVDDAATGNVLIVGNVREGSTVTTNTDGLSDVDGDLTFAYQWQVSVNGSTFTDIINDSSNVNFTIPSDQSMVGKFIQVQVTATDVSSGTTIINSPYREVINVDDPTTGTVDISGTVEEGSIVAANILALTDEDGELTFAYQWKSSDSGNAYSFNNIGGETDASYNIPSDQTMVGKYLLVAVTTTDTLGGSSTLTSASQQVANVDDAAIGTVTITGNVEEGSVVAAVTSGLSDEDGDLTFAYKWQLSDASNNPLSDISGANDVSFQIPSDQSMVGNYLLVEVTTTDALGGTTTLLSASQQVANVDDPATGRVDISGTFEEGSTLLSDISLNDPDGELTFAYKWQFSDVSNNNFTDITDASNANFTIPSDQSMVDKYVRLQVIATDASAGTTTLNSEPGLVANVNDPVTGSVDISGIISQGETLTADTTDIVDLDGLTAFSYQWARGVNDISGATSQTYVLVQADVGKAMKVTVSYTDSKGTQESVTSSATAAILNVNDAPVFSTGSDTFNAIVNIPMEYLTIPSDLDSDNLTFDLSQTTPASVNWLSFDANTLKISGIPPSDSVGANTAIVTATDPSNAFATFTLNVDVESNNAPTIVGADPSGVTVDEDASATIIDLSTHFNEGDINDVLTFSSSVTQTPSDLLSVVHSGTFGKDMTITYGANKNGQATILATATDLSGNSVSKNFSIVVNSVSDAAPLLVTPTQFVDITGFSDVLRLNPVNVDLSGKFTDADGDNLTFTVLSNNTAIVAVSSVIDNSFNVQAAGIDASGSTTIQVTASDGTDTTTVVNAFSVDVSGIVTYISNTADITTLPMTFFNTAQRMQSITTAQIPALNSTQIGNMTSIQAAQLTTTQVADFSANVTPMHYSVYDSLTHGASSSDFLTGGAINFNANSLRSQQPSTIKQFNKLTLETLTPALFKVLNQSQIAAFESQQIPFIDTTLLQVLDKVDASGSIVHFSTATSDRYRDAIQELSGIQITNLDATQVQLLSSASRLQWFNPTKLADMDSSVFGSIAPVQFDTFNAEQFAAFDVSALSNMVQPQFDKLASSTNNLFANLTASQLQAIPASLFASGAVLAAHFSRLDTKIPELTAAQIGNIAPATDALASLTTADMLNLSDLQVASLTSTFVVELSDTQRNNGFSSAQIPFISVTAINALTNSDISNLDANFTAALNVSQVSGITGQAKIQAINVQDLDSIETELTNAQLSELSTTQIVNISHPSQIAALSSVSKLQHLTTTQLAAILPEQFDDILPAQFDTFTPAQMAAFSDAVLANMTDSQYDKLALTTENLLSILDVSAINAIPDTRFLRTTSDHLTKLGGSLNLLTSEEFRNIPSSVINANISVSQLQAIPVTTIDDFSVGDISNIDISLVNLLTPVQIQSIPTGSFLGFQTSKIEAFDVNFINSLLQAQVRSFAVDNTPSQIQSLQVKDLSNILDLSDNQISNLTPAQVTSLSTGDIASLSASSKISGFLSTGLQMAAISVTQIPHVTDAEINLLSDAQVAGLTIAVLQSLDISQVEALEEQIAVLTPDANGNFPLLVGQIPFLHTTLVLPHLTAAQLQSFTGEQVAALSLPQLHVIRDTGSLTLNAFLPSQITHLTVVDHFSDVNGVLGIINDVSLFDQTRFSGFNLSQLVNLLDNHTDKFVALTAAQRVGITTAFQALAYNDVQDVSVDKLAYLTPDQLLSITSAQVTGNTSITTLAQSGAMGQNLRTKTPTDLSNLDVAETTLFYDTNYTNTAITSPFVKAFRDLTGSQIGGFAPSIMSLVNDPSNITQFTASEFDNLSDETFGVLAINLLSDSTFNALSDNKLSVLSRTQGPLLDASNIQNLDVSFSLLSPTMVDTIQVSIIPFINANSITVAQANAFTVPQAGAFTDAQTSVFTAEVLRILSNTAGFDFTTTPLEFKLSQLNTNVDVQSMQITITPGDVSQNFNYDATVQTYMPLADAKKMFLYRYSNESEVRLYVDKRNFNVNFDYFESNHLDLSDGDPIIGRHNMKFSDTSVDNSSVSYFTNSTNTQGNLGFVGNVAVNPITEDTRVPMTWDYIHYTSKEVLGVFSAYPLFNNIRTIEETMRKNINDSIRQVIVPIINNIDISSGLTDVTGAGSDTNLDIVTANNPNGSDGNAATPYDQDLIDGIANARHVVFDNTFTPSEEISATIFRTLMIQRKPDFNQTEEQEVAYGYPFRAGDSMSFIVTMSPHADQKKVAGVSGTSVGEQISPRKYRMNIQFTA